MNRVILSAVAVVFLTSLCGAQSNNKLQEAFSAEEISKLNESEKAYLVYKADRCYAVQDLSGKKDISTFPDVSELNDKAVKELNTPISSDQFEAASFNPVLFDFGKNAKMAYFRIGDTGKILKIYSEQRCRSLFEETETK